MATYEDPLQEAYAYAYVICVCGVWCVGGGGVNNFYCGERVIYLMGAC